MTKCSSIKDRRPLSNGERAKPSVIHLTSMYPLSQQGVHSGGHAVYHLVEALRKRGTNFGQRVILFPGIFERYYHILSRQKKHTAILKQEPWLPYLRFVPMVVLPYGVLDGIVNTMWQKNSGVRSLMDASVDIVHVHTPSTLGLFGLRLSRATNSIFIVTVRSEVLHWRDLPPFKRLTILDAVKHATLVVAPSRIIADSISSLTGIEPLVVPNGTTSIFDVPPPENMHRIEGRVLFVGTLTRNKGIRLLINTARHLRSVGIRIELVIIGNGPLRDEVEIAAKRDPWIKYLGWVSQEEVREQMRLAQILCVPSYIETFGIVFAEAMKQGAVVVARKGTGIDGMGNCGEHYSLIEKDDDLWEVLVQLIQNVDRRKDMSISGMVLAKTWSWDKAADTLSIVYKELYAARSNVSR